MTAKKMVPELLVEQAENVQLSVIANTYGMYN